MSLGLNLTIYLFVGWLKELFFHISYTVFTQHTYDIRIGKQVQRIYNHAGLVFCFHFDCLFVSPHSFTVCPFLA